MSNYILLVNDYELENDNMENVFTKKQLKDLLVELNDDKDVFEIIDFSCNEKDKVNFVELFEIMIDEKVSCNIKKLLEYGDDYVDLRCIEIRMSDD